ncbi:MAG: hypothetical protein GWN67_17430 [Phycisphaerae bacterium]|nr:hypothetical protein [Phycisphaerae bacterium]NIP54001.1 hypothetical protein [Phycisphaerae bacterium]NIS51310.1 hypothetical protein [Phycisphaerae bacterium]NIU10403.1 hypothetical protein [Phycisphaerae bacterium]NIU58101.1 hypothetical protein [Phycisphaerae bacterium]
MTRRKFIQKLITTGSVMMAGASWLMRKAAPRRFVRAFRVKKYPGSVRPLRDISKQSKWSG